MKPISNELLSTKVVQAVKSAIISGELAPGTKTTETQIATILGVSRTPVREALRLLNEQGFVTLVKNSGVVIADFTLEDTLGILQVRGVLEGLAARLAAVVITSDQIAHLRSIQNMLDDLEPEDSASGEEFMLADRSFHDYLIEVAGNHHISRITDSLKGRLLRLHTLLIDLSNGEILKQVRMEHGAIIEAIIAGQAERSEQLSRLHMGLMGNHVEAMVAQRRAISGETVGPTGRKLSWNSLDIPLL
ncbi:MAG: GntR family transcriptional regulator [Desulfovibrio sp.]|jgi:DNA-binding GntR family transcriptional regulator|nr:GntR family transcriptional regulator [Desulfovibrio sp.]